MHLLTSNTAIIVIGAVYTLFVFGKIFAKAGYPWWFGLLMLIPLVNLAVLFWFSFEQWPLEKQLSRPQK